MSCVIFGAGKIARGFIGHLLYLSDIPFVFVEKADVLVDLINERGQYPVNILGAPEKNCTVKGIPALKFSQEEEIIDAIAHADAVFNAVGGKNLAEIVPFYTKGIERRAALAAAGQLRRPLNFITCENWKKPAQAGTCPSAVPALSAARRRSCRSSCRMPDRKESREKE